MRATLKHRRVRGVPIKAGCEPLIRWLLFWEFMPEKWGGGQQCWYGSRVLHEGSDRMAKLSAVVMTEQVSWRLASVEGIIRRGLGEERWLRQINRCHIETNWWVAEH